MIMEAFGHLLAPPPYVLSRSSLVARVGTHNCVRPRRSIFIGEGRKNAFVAASVSNLPIGAASPRSSDKWFKEVGAEGLRMEFVMVGINGAQVCFLVILFYVLFYIFIFRSFKL